MKLINLVPKVKTFTENLLRINPIGFETVDGQSLVNIYYDTVDVASEKVLLQGNKTLTLAEFMTLTGSTDIEAINVILADFDVQAQ